ncbi:hypothetical protein F2P56_028435 [Juglans regia]|uniref:Uncharacterized protein LOC108983503 n=2 Tax=Juglans regia TaxID=51240 RepID=A0A2I4DU70_JUGRE|nr:uncharacterized protein LOC108983503 [Juglans regia]XP_018810691.1 uncharacterized protein LOC108983503 [Juglans regia]KAF5453538.1 hypothetical protein F2P56_028435 [Juglans regia]
MKSLSSVGLALSVVFGCLFLALVAELYYLLWWKKKLTHREMENDYSGPARELFYMFCWKRSSSVRHTALDPQEIRSSVGITDTLAHEPEGQLHVQSNKSFLLKPFEDDDMEAEFTRLQNLSGPPRFLFTIIEETKEDLESEDGKSRGDKSGKGSKSRSLSDLLLPTETPYLTPLASPSFLTPPLNPMNSYNQHGFNPRFESMVDAEFNRIKSSPPPKFKFLLDAEEKLIRKITEEAKEKVRNTDVFVHDNRDTASPSKFHENDEDGSFITIIVDKHKERELNQHAQKCHSSTSQVLPLASSPSPFRSPVNKETQFTLKFH